MGLFLVWIIEGSSASPSLNTSPLPHHQTAVSSQPTAAALMYFPAGHFNIYPSNHWKPPTCRLTTWRPSLQQDNHSPEYIKTRPYYY